MSNADVTAARAQYASLRASCKRHTAARFNEIARRIAMELADGECETPANFVMAAHIICSGQDCA